MIEYENLHEANKEFLQDFVLSFQQTLQSGRFILGKNVEEFEEQFARYVGVRHCVGVASGLDALILSLKALHLPDHSEVLVPSNTYIATILAILHCNLQPVLVEPDVTTCNINPERVAERITRKTKALLVVHLYGKSCEMDLLVRLSEKHGLQLIEDCAQSHGARYKNRLTGTFGRINAFSFYPTKNLGALGDAGAVVTNDDTLAKSVRMLRNYGSKEKYHNTMVGYNSRLDEIQAGFLSVKLRRLDEINSHKRTLAALYSEMISNSFTKPAVHPDFFDVYHIYNIRHKHRDKLREFLLKHDIKTEIHYPIPPHRQTALKHLWGNESFPISEEIHATTLSLPISFSHSKNDIIRVAETLNAFSAS